MIASYLALAATLVFCANLARRWFGGAADGQPKPGKIRSGVYLFMAGVLLANSIPHFIHGISGEYFPAPFSRNLGKGTATNVVNVLWGLFCLGVGCNLARAYHMHLPALARVLVCSGFIVMSIFLSVVFSKGAFR
jgi:hypothetical protein